MPQISFTKNNEQVYDRFSRLLLEEQLKRGKLTAPQMLDLLLAGWEELERIAKSDDIVIITSENIVDRGKVVTDFLEQHFGAEKLEL